MNKILATILVGSSVFFLFLLLSQKRTAPRLVYTNKATMGDTETIRPEVEDAVRREFRKR